MRGERRIYTQGIKVGHLHVSQGLLSMIVAKSISQTEEPLINKHVGTNIIRGFIMTTC